jgi:hypothetical protein
MVIRTQISLTEDQMGRLRREAHRRHVSLAAVVRDAVDRFVPDEDAERNRLIDNLLSVAGTVEGALEAAENHDAILGELGW